MSTLKVNAIEPYSGGTVTITGATINSASYAETANTLTAGDKTINGNTTINGVLNVNNANIFQDRNDGQNTHLVQNSAFFSEFYGTKMSWREPTGTTDLILGEKVRNTIELNTWSGSYDNDLKIVVDNVGAKFSDWIPGPYTDTSWLEVPQQGTPSFKRGLDVQGVAKQTFNAPTQDYVDNKEIVRVNNATISGTTYNNVWFGMGQAAAFGSNFEDYFTIEYYDSTGYNYGSELNVNGVQSTIQTAASGSGQISSLNTKDNGDGTSQVTADSLHVVMPQLGNYADDTAAAAGGVKLNGLYRNGNVVQIRIV